MRRDLRVEFLSFYSLSNNKWTDSRVRECVSVISLECLVSRACAMDDESSGRQPAATRSQQQRTVPPNPSAAEGSPCLQMALTTAAAVVTSAT